MLFGLRNNPAIFQRILSGIIHRHKLDAFCTNYIDDILIFSKSFEERLTHLDAFIRAIHSEGFRLKFVKYDFAIPSVRYLGHIIGYNSVKPINDNLAAINSFLVPKTHKQVRHYVRSISITVLSPTPQRFSNHSITYYVRTNHFSGPNSVRKTSTM